MSKDKDIQDKLKQLELDSNKDKTPVQKEKKRKEVSPINPVGRAPDWPEEIPLHRSTYKITKETYLKMKAAINSTHIHEKSINTFINTAINFYIDRTS